MKLYIVDDIVRSFVEFGMKTFHLEDFVDASKTNEKISLLALKNYMENSPEKLEMFFETKCPKCSKTVKISNILLGENILEKLLCSECGVFNQDNKNTYLLFVINEEWVEYINKKKIMRGDTMIKTGDKIRIIANTCQEGRNEFLGRCGTLIKVDLEDKTGLIYKVQLDDESKHYWFRKDEILAL